MPKEETVKPDLDRAVYSVAQVAERWSCSDGHVYALVHGGELRAFRVGHLIRIRADELLRFEQRQISASELPKEAQPKPRYVLAACHSSAEERTMTADETPQLVKTFVVALEPRMLSRKLAAQYCGVSPPTFENWCPVKPVRVGSRVLYDRKRIDDWIDTLGEPRSRGTNEWDADAELESWRHLKSQQPAPGKRQQEVTPDIQNLLEEWKEQKRLWRLSVPGTPLQKRELIGLAGLMEIRSDRIKQIKGAGMGTMERLEVRGFVELDGETLPGRCPFYKITEAGEQAWTALPESVRTAVKFETAHHSSTPKSSKGQTIQTSGA